MSGAGHAAGKRERGAISSTVRFVLLAVVSLVLTIVDYREDHLSRVRELLSLAVHPIYVAVDFPFTAWQWATDAVADRRDLLRENTELKEQLLIARSRLQDLDPLAMENARLRVLLDSVDESIEDRVLVAEILAVEPDRYRQRFIINRGSEDEVYPGQPLVNADGVVGQVERVSTRTSQALRITDADHALPVEIERTGLRTIAEGTGDTRVLRLPNLPNSADVRPGDRLVTSGLGGVFPAGRPVAVIVTFEQQPEEDFAEATARTVSRLDRDKEVLLIWRDDYATVATVADEARP